MNQKYSRNEHLKLKRKIDRLFEGGTWLGKYPLRMVYYADFELENTQIGVSVSKRNFKRAVDRNSVKRLLRECYRLHKEELSKAFPSPVCLMLIYTGRKILTFKELEEKYLILLKEQANRNTHSQIEI